MPSRLKQILKTATFRQTTHTTITTFVNGFLGAAFFFLLARLLGSEDYGRLSVITSGIITLASVADLGSDQGIVKFVSLHKDNHQFQPYAKIALWTKIVGGLCVFFVLAAGISGFSKLLFHSSQYSWAVILIGMGVLSQLLFSFTLSVSQALEKFKPWSILLVGTNISRLLLLLTVFVTGSLSLKSIGTIYVFMPLLGFIVAILNLKYLHIFNAELKASQFFQVLTYNKWVAAFVILSAISSRLDIFLTAKLSTFSVTGVYSLATQLVAVLPQLTTAVGVVMTPKFSSFRNSHENDVYLKKTILFTTGIGILSSLALSMLAFIVISFSGSDYTASWLPFVILLISMLVFLIAAPLRDSIMYFYSKPKFFFLASLLQMIITLMLGQYLIPKFGAVGSSFTNLISQIGLAISCGYYYLHLHKRHV